MYRIAVNYFVLGVEKYTENQHEEALELLTVSYIVNDRIGEEPPSMPTPANKMMKLRGLMKHFHLAVESLNTLLVNQFETGDDPGGVGERVARLIVPAIQILQARTHKQPGGRDAATLEEVGVDCCRFLILVITVVVIISIIVFITIRKVIVIVIIIIIIIIIIRCEVAGVL